MAEKPTDDLISGYEAYRATQSESKEFSLEQDYAKYRQEQAAGGSISQGAPKENFPVGATAGAIAGAGVGLGMAGMPGAVAGGLVGTVVGELGQQLYERKYDPSAAPHSVAESAARVGEQAVYQLAAEGVGRFAGGLIAGRRLFPSIPNSITPQEESAMRFLESKGVKQGYMPAEVTEARTLDVLHNISEYSLFGGGAIKAFRERRDREVFGKLADEFVDALGPRMEPDDVGRAVISTINRNKEMEKIPIKMEYNMIEREAAPGYVHVPTRMQVARTDTPITEPAMKSMKVKKVEGPESELPIGEGEQQLQGMRVKVQTQEIQKGDRLERLKVMTDQTEIQNSGARIDLSPMKEELSGMISVAKRAGGVENRAMGNTLLQFIEQQPDIVSYPVAKQLRTEVRTLGDSLKQSIENKNAPGIAVADTVYGKLTKRIEDGLREYDPFLADRWKDVNFREASRQGTFANDLVNSLVKHADQAGSGKPEAIVDQVFKRNNISTIQNLKNATQGQMLRQGDQLQGLNSTWDKLLSWHWRDVYKTAKGDGAKMEALFFGPDGLGEKAMVTAYGPERVAQYKQFVNAAKVAQAKIQDKTGTIFIQLQQPGAVMQISGAALAGLGITSDEVNWGSVAGGAGLVLAPTVLARIMTHPESAKALIQGMRIPPGTKEANALAARILPLAFPKPVSESMRQPAPARPSTMTAPMGNQP